ncbi:MAG: hypothetical protein QNJ54_20290 [Prochloraceae cyanobacterium]|nr:hypothetical protein [Prochloraceae cyanobacterium]
MENKRPKLALKETSALVTITELHNYFRSLQSYYKIAEGELVSQLEDDRDTATTKALEAKLQEVREKIDYFHVLNNAISIADTVMHTEAMIAEFKKE